MNRLKLQRIVSDPVLLRQLTEQYRVPLTVQDAKLLCLCSCGVPERKTLCGVDENVFVTRFLSVDPEDELNVLSLAQQINEEESNTFYLPFAQDSFGACFCLKYEAGVPLGVFWTEGDEEQEQKLTGDLPEFLRLLDLLK